MAARYADAGGRVVAMRKRTEAGEVDLAVRFDDLLVVVEVKSRRSIEAALGAVSAAQWSRLEGAANLCADEFGCRDIRLDLAAVDAGGLVEIVENATLAGAFR